MPQVTTPGILALHGTVAGVVRERFEFQNMTDRNVLQRYLASVPRFVSLNDALAGLGSALTIDDATRGAADAALLAREFGHDVSVFINPSQVESGEPYWYSLLHVLLDRLQKVPRLLDGVEYPTCTRADLRRLREPVKAACRAMREERARAAFVTDLAAQWGALPIEMPGHLRTLTRAELLELRDAGVDLQNHGWSHIDHMHLTAEESADEIRRGRQWLQGEIGVSAEHFAVPYGDVLPSRGLDMDARSWLTLHDEWPAGSIGPRVHNRVEPELTQPSATEGAALRPGLRGLGLRLLDFVRGDPSRRPRS